MSENRSQEAQSMRDPYRNGLEKAFNYYLKDKIKDPPKNILSVGCHFGFEAGALLKVFPTARYLGIDIDRQVLEAAEAFNDDQKNVTFKKKDARKEESFGNDPWDMIIVRHPQVLGTFTEKNELEKDWRTIINNCIKFLKQRGIMIFTVSSIDERERVLSYLKLSKIKMEIVVNEKNSFAAGVTFQDDFIVIARKS